MPYVTPEGLQAPSLEEILDDIETDQRANIDPLLITEAHEELGQVNGIFASHLREAWEVLEIAWNSRNPNAAEGSQLVATCQLTGTEKQGPTPSVFTGSRRVKVDLDDTTVLPAGTQAQVTGSNPPIYFETTEEVTADDGDGEYLVSMRCTEIGRAHV